MSSRPEIIKRNRSTGKVGSGGYLSFPSKPMPHGLLLQFTEYDYNNYIASIKKEDGGGYTANEKLGLVGAVNVADISANSTLELPFPRALSDSQGIRVQSFERDFLYERVASGLSSLTGDSSSEFLTNIGSGLKGAAGALKGGAKDFFSDPMATITAGLEQMSGVEANKATAIASYLGRNIIGGDLSRTLGVINQRVVNPQETLSFTGVDLKSYTFSWDLFPSNKADTENIRKIVQFLKNQSLPETEGIQGVNGSARAFLKYPSIVTLNLLGVQESHFQRFKRCMISNVTVDYGGGGGMPQIIKGGVPAAVTLSISFSEVQIHTRDDYLLTDGDKG